LAAHLRECAEVPSSRIAEAGCVDVSLLLFLTSSSVVETAGNRSIRRSAACCRIGGNAALKLPLPVTAGDGHPSPSPGLRCRGPQAQAGSPVAVRRRRLSCARPTGVGSPGRRAVIQTRLSGRWFRPVRSSSRPRRRLRRRPYPLG
jgi:hypothetical protein